MLKRKYPFGDFSPNQIKTHVGVKKVDTENEERMQIVHERTQQLLFQGSLKTFCTGHRELSKSNPQLSGCSKPTLVSDDNMNLVQASPMDIASSVSPRQMRIDSSGQLCMQLNKMGTTRLANSDVRKILCSSCHTREEAILHECKWCEKANCVNCLRACFTCNENFCFLCSLLNYDDIAERAYCLQCAG